MKWSMVRRFDVDSVNLFDGTTETSTLWAKSEKEALNEWREDGPSYCRDPKVVARGGERFYPAENYDFGPFIGGMILSGIKRVHWEWNAESGDGQVSVTTWVRDAVASVYHPSRDISSHETRTVVPKSIIDRFGYESVIDRMLEGMEAWERNPAKNGQVYSSPIGDGVQITIHWELDLS